MTYVIEDLNAGALPRQIEICHHSNPGRLATFAGDGLHKTTVLSSVFPQTVRLISVCRHTKGTRTQIQPCEVALQQHRAS
jgi:hypothetical protein